MASGCRDDLLVRPRLIARLSRVPAGGIVLIGAHHFLGIATVVSQWLSTTGDRVVWWSAMRTVPTSADVPSEGAPDVVVIELTGGPLDGATVVAWRGLCPSATLVVRSSFGWPSGALREGLGPDHAVNGGDLLFTTDEIIEHARALGLPISEFEAGELRDATSGVAALVDEILREAVRGGQLDVRAVIAGSDTGLGRLAAFIASGMASATGRLWHILRLTAAARPLSGAAIAAIGESSPTSAAALQTIRESHVVTGDAENGFTLPSALAGAIDRLTVSSPPDEPFEEFLASLASTFIRHGIIAELLEVCPPSARTALLREHWPHLLQVPADDVRRLIGQIRPIEAHMRIAHVRALIDVTHRGHTGTVTRHDLEIATGHLRQIRSTEDLAPGTTLHMQWQLADAIVRRLDGDVDEARSRHVQLLDRLDFDDPLRAQVEAHAGLSALEAGDVSAAVTHLSGVRDGVDIHGNEWLAQFAADLVAGLMSSSSDAVSWWAGDRRASSRGPGEAAPAHRARGIWNALQRLDSDGLRQAVGGPMPMMSDDPLTLGIMEQTMRAVAYGLLQAPSAGLQEADIFEARIAGRRVLAHHDELLTAMRMESMYFQGFYRESLEISRDMLERHDVHPLAAVFEARSQLALGNVDEAERALEERPGIEARRGRFAQWTHVLRCLIHRDAGRQADAADELQSAIAIGARSNNLLPFARQGIPNLVSLVGMAERLRTDPLSGTFIRRLAVASDELVSSGPTVKLTPRQAEILDLMPSVEGIRPLANALHISPNTVKTQLRQIYQRLGVTSWEAAVHRARAASRCADER